MLTAPPAPLRAERSELQFPFVGWMARKAFEFCCGFCQSADGHVDGSRTTERPVPSRNTNVENVGITPSHFKFETALHSVGSTPSPRVNSISMAWMLRTGDSTQ